MTNTKPVNILLVDDEPANVLVLKSVLATLDVTLITAFSGEEALKQVLLHDFAVILLDVLMPTMSGFETARLIRSRPQSGPTPIIFVTAAPDAPGFPVEEAYALGAVDYLSKPVNATVLRAKVAVFVALYRKTAELADMERQRNAAILKDKNRRIRLILDNARDYAFIVTDSDGLVTEWEGGSEVIIGWRPEEVIGQPFSVIFTPEDRAAGRPDVELNEARQAGRAQDKRWHLRKDGSRFFADGVLLRLDDDNGQIHGFTKIFRDATALRQGEDALRTSEERVRLATDAAQLGIWIWDAEKDQVTWENERMYDIFGLSPAEGPISALRFVTEILYPDDAPAYERATAAARQSGRFYFEGRTRTPLGEIRWTESTGQLHFAADGTPLRLIGTTADITQRKRAEEALQQLASSLSEADRRKTEFLATLAHELRNPLAPIRSGLEVMRLGADDPSIVSRVRETMERQIAHMVHLVDDLLDIARITQGKVELKKQRIALKLLTETAVEASLPLIESGKHELSVAIPDESMLLHVDPIRMTQVLSNLLNNAAKYTPHGGRIALSAGTEGPEVFISVTDNGVGIAAESLPSLFQMFSQVGRDLNRAQGGLGIGLSLVRWLVELHGGTVTATSAGPGCGTTFTIRLPLEFDDVVETPAAMPAMGSGPNLPFRALRVLIVDDNIDAVETLSALLEIGGHATAVANDGYQALALSKEFRPDVVFLDIGMPGMNGYETAHALRQILGMERVNLVALTGWGTDNDRERSVKAGIDHHLTKPASLATVNDLLAAIWASHMHRTLNH